MRLSVSGLWGRFRELIVYCMVGCTGATLDFVVYALLAELAGWHYQISNLISVSFGIVNNFFLNYHFNFNAKDHLVRRLISFYCVGVFGCLMSACCLWILVEKSGISLLVAKVATIVFVTVAQFCLNKFVTFKKGGTQNG